MTGFVPGFILVSFRKRTPHYVDPAIVVYYGFLIVRRVCRRAAIQSGDVPGDAMALYRPVSRWAHFRNRRYSRPAKCLLHGRDRWRSLEKRRLRSYVEPDLRWTAHGL